MYAGSGFDNTLMPNNMMPNALNPTGRGLSSKGPTVNRRPAHAQRHEPERDSAVEVSKANTKRRSSKKRM